MSSVTSRSLELSKNRPLSGRTILFAEDNERLRKVTEMMLAEAGARVIVVGSGASAIEEYLRNLGAIDLVLVDLKMNGMGGEAVFERLLEIDPNVKVVLSSGLTPDSGLVERIRSHDGGFIEKPYTVDKLCEVIDRVISGSVPSDKKR